MPILHIDHKVRDFKAWKEAFDSDPAGREQGGVRRYQVFRSVDDPNYVMIDLEFDSTKEAEAFQASLHELWGRVADKLGLENAQARIIEKVESKQF